jgi:hypothetical protein
MLPIGIKHDDGVGWRCARQEVAPAGGNRVTLSEVRGQAKQADARIGGEPGECGGSVGGHAVVDEENVTHVRPHLLDEGGVRRPQVGRYQRRDARRIERAV